MAFYREFDPMSYTTRVIEIIIFYCSWATHYLCRWDDQLWYLGGTKWMSPKPFKARVKLWKFFKVFIDLDRFHYKCMIMYILKINHFSSSAIRLLTISPTSSYICSLDLLTRTWHCDARYSWRLCCRIHHMLGTSWLV